MNTSELKHLQAPLKEQYRAEPESAVITLKAQGKVADGISCKIETGRALVEAGLHPATGGTGLLACSGDMLLEALAACASHFPFERWANNLEISRLEGKLGLKDDRNFCLPGQQYTC